MIGASLSCFYTDVFFIALYYFNYYNDNSAGLEVERQKKKEKNAFRVTFTTRMPLEQIRAEFMAL